MVTLPHTYFENSCKALISFLGDIYKPFSDNVLKQNSFPIQMVNTGDEVYINNYMSTKKYTSIPRMDLSVRGISLDNEQSTNGNVMGNLKVKNDAGFEENIKSPVKRHSVDINLTVKVRFNNIFEYMKFVDYMLTISYNNFSFEFYYLGYRYPCNIGFPTDFENETNYGLEFNDQDRGTVMDMNVNFTVQYPAFNVYEITRNSGEIFKGNKSMIKLVSNIFTSKTKDGNYKKVTTDEITKEDIN